MSFPLTFRCYKHNKKKGGKKIKTQIKLWKNILLFRMTNQFSFDPRRRRWAQVKALQDAVNMMPTKPILPEKLRAKGQIYTIGTVEETLWNAEGGPKKYLENKGWIPRSSKDWDTKSLQVCKWNSVQPIQIWSNSKLVQSQMADSGDQKKSIKANELNMQELLMEVGDIYFCKALSACTEESKERLNVYLRAMFASILGSCRHAFDDMTQCSCFEKKSNLVRARCLKKKELAKRLKYPDIKSEIMRIISANSSTAFPQSELHESASITLLRKVLVFRGVEDWMLRCILSHTFNVCRGRKRDLTLYSMHGHTSISEVLKYTSIAPYQRGL